MVGRLPWLSWWGTSACPIMVLVHFSRPAHVNNVHPSLVRHVFQIYMLQILCSKDMLVCSFQKLQFEEHVALDLLGITLLLQKFCYVYNVLYIYIYIAGTFRLYIMLDNGRGPQAWLHCNSQIVKFINLQITFNFYCS